jgi:hypothetical protein
MKIFSEEAASFVQQQIQKTLESDVERVQQLIGAANGKLLMQMSEAETVRMLDTTQASGEEILFGIYDELCAGQIPLECARLLHENLQNARAKELDVLKQGIDLGQIEVAVTEIMRLKNRDSQEPVQS